MTLVWKVIVLIFSVWMSTGIRLRVAIELLPEGNNSSKECLFPCMLRIFSATLELCLVLVQLFKICQKNFELVITDLFFMYTLHKKEHKDEYVSAVNSWVQSFNPYRKVHNYGYM